MLSELFVLLGLSISGISSNSTKEIATTDINLDSPYSFQYVDENESNISVCFGNEMFYLEDGEYKEYPSAFSETTGSYYLSVLDTTLSIDKNNLNSIHISNGIKQSNIVFETCISKSNKVTLSDKTMSFVNTTYEINNTKLTRKDIINNPLELSAFSINSSFNNITIEVYDSEERLITIDDYNAFQNAHYSVNADTSNYSYPLSIISNIQYVEPSKGSSYIQDKYFEVGSSSCISGTSLLKVGQDSLLAVDPLGNYYYPEYKTVVEITLPTFSDTVPHYLNITLKYKFSSGSLNTIHAYKVNNKTYSQMNGSISYTSSYLGAMIKTSGYYTLQYRNTYTGITSSNNKMVIVFEGHSSNVLANIYANESSSYPTLIREHHSIYGDATLYNEVISQYVNCYGYVIGTNAIVYLDTDTTNALSNTISSAMIVKNSSTYYSFASALVTDLENKAAVTTARLLDSYDSYVSSGERRIAFRFYYRHGDATVQFHFMKQCKYGTWAEKSGISNSQHLDNYGNDYPDDLSHWPYESNTYYDSPAFYFAIS